ncbi:hypothetical protein N7468_003308 [Penicillium chermesinum]|uniref:DNA repair protein XRCC4 n=1 Tax=Penicillium chermesinum TaxID=63820 RepID=A0A9W9TT87_9EURO|nr:uncharacterized protein N7468_003308 [Penicillium chermesinum]KAJ5238689.1 hypothetical protein N7468_003308 [Penicillium chermesinum]KAJ6164334.1 hypothetical protein N7470_003006 [Penicillium chermesinum]
MSLPRVIRIARSDESNTFILLNVRSAGPAPLDVRLTATEGESPYTALVQASQIGKFRFKNYQGSDQEWNHIVSLILGQSIAIRESGPLAGLEATASIAETKNEGKEIVITIRKKVQSITQKLGAFILKQDDEQAIELFEWSGIAAATAESFRSQVMGLNDRCRVAEDTINRLKEQLEDLLQAKDQHEQQLMASFAHLLNEKKLKIRTQQRLLASATVDPVKVSELRGVVARSIYSRETESLAKRRAQDVDHSDGVSGGDSNQMDIDRPNSAGSFASQTTDDEDQDLATHDTHGDELQPSGAQATPTEDREQMHSPNATAPPRRQLPFTRRVLPESNNETKTVSTEMADEPAGETDDDEL